jgi:hypothetical protein
MAMIFPGMDPYLEDPGFWPAVHSRLIVYLADQMRPRLRPRYIASVEERVYVEGTQRDIAPDVVLMRGRTAKRSGRVAVLEPEVDAPILVRVSELEIHESYIAILDRKSGLNVVTVIEVVSPSNKFAGPGRNLYLAKQREVLSSRVHLVEIDLLLRGPHVLAIPEWLARGQAGYHSLVCVNRAEGQREEFELYPRGLRERLPRVGIPLAEADPDVPLDVQAALEQAYEAGDFRERLPYDKPCHPPLPPEEQAWVDQRIREALQAGPQAGP